MGAAPHVLILSGFLGSGKTTLLVRLVNHLRAKHGEDYRIAIVENEIGSVSVDTGIIGDAGYSVTEILAGCVCCTLIGQLVPALAKLREELDPNLIILEATGVATPDTMRRNIEKYAEYPVRVATLVDASRWQKIILALRMLLEAQVEPADVLCVTKTDLVDEATIAEVETQVREFNATAPFVHMSADVEPDDAFFAQILGEETAA